MHRRCRPTTRTTPSHAIKEVSLSLSLAASFGMPHECSHISTPSPIHAGHALYVPHHTTPHHTTPHHLAWRPYEAVGGLIRKLPPSLRRVHTSLPQSTSHSSLSHTHTHTHTQRERERMNEQVGQRRFCEVWATDSSSLNLVLPLSYRSLIMASCSSSISTQSLPRCAHQRPLSGE